MDTEIIEQLLEKLINEQNTNATNLTKLIEEQKAEIKGLKNQGGDIQGLEELKALIERQSLDIEGLKNKKTVLDVSKYLEQPKGSSVTIFGGNEAHITYKWLLSIIGIVLVSYFGFKYIPNYLIELEKTKTNNIFVNYLKLQQFKENGTAKSVDDYLDMINNKDSAFFKRYDEYKAYSDNETERIQTENKIKELQDKLEATKH